MLSVHHVLRFSQSLCFLGTCFDDLMRSAVSPSSLSFQNLSSRSSCKTWSQPPYSFLLCSARNLCGWREALTETTTNAENLGRSAVSIKFAGFVFKVWERFTFFEDSSCLSQQRLCVCVCVFKNACVPWGHVFLSFTRLDFRCVWLHVALCRPISVWLWIFDFSDGTPLWHMPSNYHKSNKR